MKEPFGVYDNLFMYLPSNPNIKIHRSVNPKILYELKDFKPEYEVHIFDDKIIIIDENNTFGAVFVNEEQEEYGPIIKNARELIEVVIVIYKALKTNKEITSISHTSYPREIQISMIIDGDKKYFDKDNYWKMEMLVEDGFLELERG